MREPPINICPLLAIAGVGETNRPAICVQDHCALWDFGGNECVIVTAAVAAREIAENLEECAAVLEAYKKNAAPSAANTEDGKEAQHDH